MKLFTLLCLLISLQVFAQTEQELISSSVYPQTTTETVAYAKRITDYTDSLIAKNPAKRADFIQSRDYAIKKYIFRLNKFKEERKAFLLAIMQQGVTQAKNSFSYIETQDTTLLSNFLKLDSGLGIPLSTATETSTPTTVTTIQPTIDLTPPTILVTTPSPDMQSCASLMLYWKSGSAYCGAQASETAHGQSLSVQDVAGTTGTASFTCSNGTWTPSNTHTCTNPTVSTDATITNVSVVSTAAGAQANVPITFGHVFAKGHLMPNQSVTGTLTGGVSIPLQMDVKATHADGSVRHAIVSGVILSLLAGQSINMDLVKRATSPNNAPAVTPASLLANGFSAGVTLNVAGLDYSAAVENLMAGAPDRTWLSGPTANEWHYSASLKNAGTPHPHLSVRFAIRAYSNSVATVDVTVENTWTYGPNPQNYLYDGTVLVGGVPVFTTTGLNHFRQARWRKVFWWGATAPAIDLKHNSAYLIATKAVPNYDPTTVASESGLSALNTKWNTSDTGLMRNGIVNAYFPATGGRPDIGPLPQWNALHVISMDPRAKRVSLGTGDLAGHFPIHFRDKNTGYPLSIENYPYAGNVGTTGDHTPPGGASQKFPPCPFEITDSKCEASWSSGLTKIVLTPDDAHQPSMAYYPYLITGDYFYLEELHFWANYNILTRNPPTRGLDKGLTPSMQVRGQAWSLRTITHAAYLTPDTHPLKGYFTSRLSNNLQWYNQTYSNNPNTNLLGFVDGKGGLIQEFNPIAYAVKSVSSRGIAPWQDDYFTWSIGNMVEMGVGDALLQSEAAKLLAWKSKFPVGRMTASGYCWNDASIYNLAVRDGGATTAFYTTFEQVWRASAPNLDGGLIPSVNSKGNDYFSFACAGQGQADWKTQMRIDQGITYEVWGPLDMVGYPTSAAGYPSNMQPALAVAAQSGLLSSDQAWRLFINRTKKPDYSVQPQWSIVPRN